jgi:HEAT repeat protein
VHSSFEEIVERLRSPSSVVRNNACVDLGKTGAARAVEPLLGRLSDEDPNVRGAACRALARLRDRRAVDPLIARLADRNPGARAAACKALGELREACALGPLIGLLGDGEWLVRAAACDALGGLGEAHAVEPLIAQLADGHGLVRRAACDALAGLGEARAVEPLIGRLGDLEWPVREAACMALGRLRDARAAEPLIGRLGDFEDREWRVREAARKALRELGGCAVEPLVARLADRDYKRRLTVCQFVAEMGGGRAVEPLIARLADESPEIRAVACKALGKLGDRCAADPLIPRLGDKDSRVRQAACAALERLGEGNVARAVAGSINGQTGALAELMAAEGDFRAQDPMVLSLAWSLAAARAVAVFSKALKSQWKTLLCSACLARMELKREQNAEWYACRVCGKLGHALMGIENVVAVLDEGWPEEQRREGGALRVNWLRRKALFDFDSVEIVRVTDLEAERFCIAVGNDMDEYRRVRYKKMSCAIRDGGASEGALRNLRSQFGRMSRTA